MNRNQWFVFAGILLLMSVFFMGMADGAATVALMHIMEYPGEGSLVYVAQSIRSAIYGSSGTICLGLFFIFLICGYLERKK